MYNLSAPRSTRSSEGKLVRFGSQLLCFASLRRNQTVGQLGTESVVRRVGRRVGDALGRRARRRGRRRRGPGERAARRSRRAAAQG